MSVDALCLWQTIIAYHILSNSDIEFATLMHWCTCTGSHKLEQNNKNATKHSGKLLLSGWAGWVGWVGALGALIVHWQGRHSWDSIGTMGCGCLLWWRCGSVSTGSKEEPAAFTCHLFCRKAISGWSKQHFHSWSFVNFMFSLPNISHFRCQMTGRGGLKLQGF